MSKRTKADGRDDRIVIYTRIKSETVQAIDEIREGMPFTPSRAQVIDVALAEYVGRHGKKHREAQLSNRHP
jgi:hypothetical protein